jgi:Uncharacterized protein conserved in bacteria
MNYMQYQPDMGLQTPEQRQMAMFLHLSQLANVLLFPLGIVAPIIIWQTQKEKMPALDAHGKMVVNFMISMTIYLVIGSILTFILMFLVIGFLLIPVLAVLGLLGIIFPIIGGVKANNGELWEYPLTIKFLK